MITSARTKIKIKIKELHLLRRFRNRVKLISDDLILVPTVGTARLCPQNPPPLARRPSRSRSLPPWARTGGGTRRRRRRGSGGSWRGGAKSETGFMGVADFFWFCTF